MFMYYQKGQTTLENDTMHEYFCILERSNKPRE